MFALTISQDGRTFKSYFQEGRLRKYNNLPLAINASKQLFNNVKNNLHTIRIIDDTDNSDVVVLVKENGSITVTHCKDTKQENKTSTKRENTVPLESLIDKPKEDRVEFLKECHKSHIEKKKSESKTPAVSGNTLNNIAEPQQDKKAQEFITSFNAKVIEIAIKMKDYKTLFNTELSLSQKGYSWYPDENNEIKIAPTQQVLELINKNKI